MSDPFWDMIALYPPSARPIVPVAWPLGDGRGLSGAKLWSFQAPYRLLVARRWPEGGPAISEVAEIHRWLGKLSGLGFIPILQAASDGKTVVASGGHLWEVSTWMPGSADTARPPNRSRIQAAFAALAEVHRVLSTESRMAVAPGLVSRMAEVDGLLAGGLDRIDAAVRRSANGRPADLALRWLAAARSGLPGLRTMLRESARRPVAVQPVIRDARAEHFFFEGNDVTGLVDFGAMGVDSPAADLARLLGDMVGESESGRKAALETYAAVRPIDVALIAVYEEANAWLGPHRWARWRFIEGRTFDDPEAPSKGLERTVGRLFDRLRSRPIIDEFS